MQTAFPILFSQYRPSKWHDTLFQQRKQARRHSPDSSEQLIQRQLFQTIYSELWHKNISLYDPKIRQSHPAIWKMHEPHLRLRPFLVYDVICVWWKKCGRTAYAACHINRLYRIICISRNCSSLMTSLGTIGGEAWRTVSMCGSIGSCWLADSASLWKSNFGFCGEMSLDPMLVGCKCDVILRIAAVCSGGACRMWAAGGAAGRQGSISTGTIL